MGWFLLAGMLGAGASAGLERQADQYDILQMDINLQVDSNTSTEQPNISRCQRPVQERGLDVERLSITEQINIMRRDGHPGGSRRY